MALLALQFALPIRTTLPETVGVAPRRLAASPAPAVGGYPEILQAPIFAPNRAGGGLPGAPAGVDSYALVGVASGPGFATAFVKGPDGATRAVRPGQELAGWRVAGVGRSQLVLTRGAERRAIALGPTTAATGATTGATAPATSATTRATPGATDDMGVPPQVLADEDEE